MKFYKLQIGNWFSTSIFFRRRINLNLSGSPDVKTKWENSSWGRKLIVQKRRVALNHFDRFKLMLAKIKRVGVVRQELAKLKKTVA